MGDGMQGEVRTEAPLGADEHPRSAGHPDRTVASLLQGGAADVGRRGVGAGDLDGSRRPIPDARAPPSRRARELDGIGHARLKRDCRRCTRTCALRGEARAARRSRHDRWFPKRLLRSNSALFRTFRTGPSRPVRSFLTGGRHPCRRAWIPDRERIGPTSRRPGHADRRHPIAQTLSQRALPVIGRSA